ncbi:MAG: DUF362 domain-containing protein [Dehalococcoidia bacterium]|jgi:uncharacterized protein (DUF362 family)
MGKVTRRDFLRLSAGAAVALGAAQGLAACGSEPATPKPTPGRAARVAAVRGTDLAAMTRQSLNALGGMGAIVKAGETVFIKPNMVTLPWASLGRNPFVIGECAKPEIVAALAEECLRAGATQVTIGDATQMPSYSWDYATTLDGSTNLVKEAARLNSTYPGTVKLACLDADSPAWREIPSRAGLSQSLVVSSLVADADRVISVPVLKTHQWAQLTLSLKCFLGTTPLARYGAKADGTVPRIYLHLASAGIEQVFLDVVTAVKPDLAVIDGSICVEGNGPSVGDTAGLTVDMRKRLGAWLLLASTDLAAADATAARIVKHDVTQIRQLNMAYEQQLGEIHEEEIEVVGERLADLRVDWVPAAPGQLSRHGYGPVGVAFA